MNTIERLSKLSKLTDLLGKAHMLIDINSKISLESSVERKSFFAIEKAIETTLTAVEDEINTLDMNGALQGHEYSFYMSIIDRLRKL